MHLVNLSVHIGAGTFAIALGILQLFRRKGGTRHRSVGRIFIAATLIVTGSALIGTLAFRFMPLFAVLTLLTTYVAVGAWRVAKTRERGPEWIDLLWTLLAIGVGAAVLPILMRAPATGISRPVVMWSTVAGLALVVAYDLLRWVFPRRWFRDVWLPEHIYKVLSALFGLISAFVGNVIRWGQPWSQVAPFIVSTVLVLYWWRRAAEVRDARRAG